MPDLLVRSFTPLLLAFQPCFTQPSFSSFWALTCAWILCSGRRSLTRIIQAAQLRRSNTSAPFIASSARPAGTSMTWATVSSNCCYLFVPRSWSAPSTTPWRVNPGATSGAPACTTIHCAPLRNAPSFPSATTASSSPCKSPFPSLPPKSGPSPSWSACIANGRNRSSPQGAMESWRATNRSGHRQAISNPSSTGLGNDSDRGLLAGSAHTPRPGRQRVCRPVHQPPPARQYDLISRMNMNAALYELPPLHTTTRAPPQERRALAESASDGAGSQIPLDQNHRVPLRA